MIKVISATRAIRAGFGVENTLVQYGSDEKRQKTVLVWVDGYRDPIEVTREKVNVPDCFPDVIKAGIRLDMQAIHA